MFGLIFNRRNADCDGATRRDFIKVGGLGLGGMSLSGLMAARSQAAAQGLATKDTSVVWLWLGGGPTHVETFDPKMSAPSEYRSVTGEVPTNIPGVTLGGNFVKTAAVADKMAFVRSFAHRNSGHGGGTHWVMTGYDNRLSDNGGVPTRPSLGSIVSRVRGANHPVSGMPTYVGSGNIGSDGPAFLGTAFGPFRPAGQARKNMDLAVEQARIDDRRALLHNLDRIKRETDRSGLMEGLDRFEQQAFSLVLGNASKAFDLNDEKEATKELYGKGLGLQMLTARRLCEAGAGFVTVSYGGWDMHGNIKQAMDRRGPELDRSIAAFVQDLADRGMSEKVLLVVTGEFGRTPKVNKNNGRDHWAPLSTLALAGGGLRMGQTVGESAAKVDVPKSTPITPQDLMATVFQVLGIPLDTTIINNAGRPVHMLDGGRPIAELV